ncbi:MAG: tRNA (guanosine(37)-N1)-methyltransferase TrmD [Campylobacterales bacterium]|nr:tRNA (guanosine(37)-N1)-methyltransferase TrmD [Campylobacterales bacterium]
MKITYVTLFKNLIDYYFHDSILKIAKEKELFEIDYKNPRDYTTDKHNRVDDYKQGGGAGMVMTPQPLFDLLGEIKEKNPQAKIIFPVPAGKPFRQNDSVRLAKQEHLVFVSGRYEGIDERVIETYADEVFSIGDYVLTGGELPSLVMSDAILRNIEGVLGNNESLEEESFNTDLLEAPSFAKPYDFRSILSVSENLKGNHANIRSQNLKMAQLKTKYFRPDLV